MALIYTRKQAWFVQNLLPSAFVLALDLYHCSVGKDIWITELSVRY